MITISSDFKTAMKQPIKELDAYIKLDEDNKITSADDLISFKISCDTSMCKTAMRKLEAKYLGEHNLLGQWVHVGFGVKLPNGTFEYLDYGSFLITEITYTKDTGVTQVTGYDKMINSMTKYSKLNIEYPITLYEYTQILCNKCGLILGNETFVHANWPITQELWENIDGITYRDILVQIAQVTASTCIISNDDKVYFKSIYNTDETLTYDNMKKLKLEPIYGEINSVVLSRTPQEDNIYMRDEESIQTNGLTEYKIENNEIIDKDRDNAMTPIYNALHGISYYPFETTTEGLGWYEIADNFDIINDNEEIFNTTLFNFSITIDGGINETLKTTAETKTQTQYQYATTIEKRVKNTELIVNKQEQEITSLVYDMYDNDGMVSEQLTSINQNLNEIEMITSNLETTLGDNYYQKQDIEQLILNAESGLTNIFSTSGGNNLLRNTAPWYGNGFEWDYWEGNVARIQEKDSATTYAFSLQNGITKQTIQLADGYYSISFKYKKLLDVANAKIRYNNREIILEDEGTIQTTGLVNTKSFCFEMECDTNGGYEIYELMLNHGEAVYLPWMQNQNEIKTTNVSISENIKVESNVENTVTTLGANGLIGTNKSTNVVVFKQTEDGSYSKNVEADRGAIGGLSISKVENQTWLTGV